MTYQIMFHKTALGMTYLARIIYVKCLNNFAAECITDRSKCNKIFPSSMFKVCL